MSLLLNVLRAVDFFLFLMENDDILEKTVGDDELQFVLDRPVEWEPGGLVVNPESVMGGAAEGQRLEFQLRNVALVEFAHEHEQGVQLTFFASTGQYKSVGVATGSLSLQKSINN